MFEIRHTRNNSCFLDRDRHSTVAIQISHMCSKVSKIRRRSDFLARNFGSKLLFQGRESFLGRSAVSDFQISDIKLSVIIGVPGPFFAHESTVHPIL